MPTSIFKSFHHKYILAAAIWTLLAGGSVTWNIKQETNETMSTAIATAQTNIAKDIAFRKWVALHGGVYVPPTQNTPPNPYLKIPDRDVVTTTGKALTLMNPAYALRELQTLSNKGNPVKTHITSLKLINPNNKADDWETFSLKSFEQGTKESLQVVNTDGQSHLRLMKPFIVEAPCLKCHSQQDYKLGDIRGGISADVPLSIFEVGEHNRIIQQAISHAILWLLGIAGLGFAYRRERAFDNERRRTEKQMQQMAQYDALTKLPNRTLFSDRFQQTLSRAKRDKAHFALLFIDLDKFKPINDELGHQVGDLLLKEASSRMQDCVREADTIARIGGDEFVVLLPAIDEAADAILVAEKIHEALNKPFFLAGQNLHISSSTGIAIYPEHGSDELQLMKNADVAMYRTKERGRDNVALFQSEMLR